jgi:hypothetical protein
MGAGLSGVSADRHGAGVDPASIEDRPQPWLTEHRSGGRHPSDPRVGIIRRNRRDSWPCDGRDAGIEGYVMRARHAVPRGRIAAERWTKNT